MVLETSYRFKEGRQVLINKALSVKSRAWRRKRRNSNRRFVDRTRELEITKQCLEE
jgi:hypothetical protein